MHARRGHRHGRPRLLRGCRLGARRRPDTDRGPRHGRCHRPGGDEDVPDRLHRRRAQRTRLGRRYPMTTGAPGRPRRRRRAVAGLAVLATVVAGAAAVALTRSSAADTAGGAPASGLTTAAVERRDLVVTETLTGELAYADVRTVTSARKGTVTTIAAAGTTVAVGSALFSIDLEPAVVLR